MATQGKSKGGSKKYSREGRRPSHQKYNSHNRRDKNKRKKILRSNGEKALAQYIAGNKAEFPRVKRNPPAPQHRKVLKDE